MNEKEDPRSETEENPTRGLIPVSPGLSIIGLFVTGIVGIIVGITSGSGIALIASVLAFGWVAWIAFR